MGDPPETNVQWGVCTMFIPGGFGSEKQNDPEDSSHKESIREKKYSTKNHFFRWNKWPISIKKEHKGPSFLKARWYGAGGREGGIPLSFTRQKHNNNNPIFIKSFKSLQRNSPSIGTVGDAVFKTIGSIKSTGYLKKKGNMADFIENFESNGTNRNKKMQEIALRTRSTAFIAQKIINWTWNLMIFSYMRKNLY